MHVICTISNAIHACVCTALVLSVKFLVEFVQSSYNHSKQNAGILYMSVCIYFCVCMSAVQVRVFKVECGETHPV